MHAYYYYWWLGYSNTSSSKMNVVCMQVGTSLLAMATTHGHGRPDGGGRPGGVGYSSGEATATTRTVSWVLLQAVPDRPEPACPHTTTTLAPLASRTRRMRGGPAAAAAAAGPVVSGGGAFARGQSRCTALQGRRHSTPIRAGGWWWRGASAAASSSWSWGWLPAPHQFRSPVACVRSLRAELRWNRTQCKLWPRSNRTASMQSG
jgi:hypothetical protein